MSSGGVRFDSHVVATDAPGLKQEIIAHVLYSDLGNLHYETFANAHLISAAPCLLAALRETLAIATRNEEGEFAVRARAAIARAEGRAP